MTTDVEEMVSGVVYAVLLAVGTDPSVVYLMTATPERSSVAVMVTWTGDANHPVPHGLPLHEMVLQSLVE